MCIAPPLYQKDSDNDSIIWRQISSSPLNLLGFSAGIQLIVILAYWYLTYSNVLNSTNTVMDSQLLIPYLLLFSLSPVLIFAMLMQFYPTWLRGSGEIEYLHYAGYFFLGIFNLFLILLGNSWNEVILGFAIILQLLLLLYAYKPLWWLSFWANKKAKGFSQAINFIMASYVGANLFFLLGYFFDFSSMTSIALYASSLLWLVFVISLPKLAKSIQ